MEFTEFNFSEKVREGIQKAGFTECMPVQTEVFQHALESQQDVTVQSRTGTGKTAAFLLTIFELFTRNSDTAHKALIIAPTRELAVQIEQEAKLLGSHLPYKIGSFYGGMGYKTQDRLLKEGVDIIIGTPGRLLDYAKSKKLQLNDVDTLVIDEADRLFDMGFLPDLKKILKQMIKPGQRQTMLFSATLGTRVSQLAWEFMHNAREIVIDNDRVTVDEITQELYHTSNAEKFTLLLGLLQRENPSNAIIFSNTKDMAVKLAKRLSLNDYHAEFIMGDLPQRKRLSIINRIKEGNLQILVATDVAARGLHINDLDIVINYDLPEDPENYVHRIGRTARAGKSGKAISLACEKYVYGLEAIQEFIDMKIPVEWADETLLEVEDKSKGVRVSGPQAQRSSRSKGRSQSSRKGSNNSNRGGSRKSSHSKTRSTTASSNSTTKTTQSSKNLNKPPKQKKQQPVKPSEPAKKDDLESRLEYYRKKYGEDFELTASTKSDTQSKPRRTENTQRKRAQRKSTGPQQAQKTESGEKKGGFFQRLLNKIKS